MMMVMMMRVRWLRIGFCGFLCFFLLAASFLYCSFLFGKTQKLRSPHSSSPHHQPPTNKLQTTQRERNTTEKNLEKKKKRRRRRRRDGPYNWKILFFLISRKDDHQHMWVAKLLKQTMI
jgi:hypothetical protein